MSAFLHHVELSAPLFLLVLAGYLLAASGRWPKPAADALSRFVFAVALPALLFSLMSDFSPTTCCLACRSPARHSARRRCRRWPWCWCSTR
ncbi:MAG: AEC family transporter [Burkholderiaceae bacterium]|nr:AEC family transporter [Burkholderiaceae bacterium]